MPWTACFEILEVSASVMLRGLMWPPVDADMEPAGRSRSSSKAVGPMPRASRQTCVSALLGRRIGTIGPLGTAGGGITSSQAWFAGVWSSGSEQLAPKVLARTGRRPPLRSPTGSTGTFGVIGMLGCSAEASTDAKSMFVGRAPGRLVVGLLVGGVGVGATGIVVAERRAFRGLPHDGVAGGRGADGAMG